LRDAQNAIIGYLLIGTDNTARKQAEADRRCSISGSAINSFTHVHSSSQH